MRPQRMPMPQRTCCPESPKEPRKFKIRVTMKTSQSSASGKAGHPVSLKFVFNFFSNSWTESEGSLTTWDFGSSETDGCFPVAQKGSTKKAFVRSRGSDCRIFPAIMVHCHLFTYLLSNSAMAYHQSVLKTFPGFIVWLGQSQSWSLNSLSTPTTHPPHKLLRHFQARY